MFRTFLLLVKGFKNKEIAIVPSSFALIPNIKGNPLKILIFTEFP